MISLTLILFQRENIRTDALKNPIHRNKVKEGKKGIKYLNKEGKKKMAVPITEKWNQLIADGYKEGY